MHREKESMEREKGGVPICRGPTLVGARPRLRRKWRMSPFFPWTGALWLVSLGDGQAGCCQDGQKPCNDITPGAIPQPNGTYACQWIHGADGPRRSRQLVIYQYEWSADATQAEATKLTPFGQEHLAGSRWGCVKCPFRS